MALVIALVFKMGSKVSREEFDAVKERLRELEEKLNPPQQPVAQQWNPGEQQVRYRFRL